MTMNTNTATNTETTATAHGVEVRIPYRLRNADPVRTARFFITPNYASWPSFQGTASYPRLSPGGASLRRFEFAQVKADADLAGPIDRTSYVGYGYADGPADETIMYRGRPLIPPTRYGHTYEVTGRIDIPNAATGFGGSAAAEAERLAADLTA